MKPKIKRIYLSWRPKRSAPRIIVGEVKHNTSDTIFRYIQSGVKEAIELGFTGFPDFPDYTKEYNRNIVAILSRRVNDSTRSDIKQYYDFWRVPYAYASDPIVVLAYTGGMLPTDNFEFLADFYSIKGLEFVTDIAGLSTHQSEAAQIQEGDSLLWKREPQNSYDANAVALYKENEEIGYIKAIHNRIFKHPRANLSVRVLRVDRNGHINRIFLLISNKAINP